MSKRLKKGAFIEAFNKETGETYQGTIKTYNKSAKQVEIITPGGVTKTIDILQFIVVILPLLDQIVDWVVSKFKKKDK